MARSEPLMGTMVTIHVAGPAAAARPQAAAEAIDRAFEWFRRIEHVCTRFNPGSELMRLTSKIGTAVEASPILFEAVQFALAVAEETGGAFDPTVGREMEMRGFNREYSTGRVQRTDFSQMEPRPFRMEPRTFRSGGVTYRDVAIDPDRRTITVHRPLILDLGGVAKGLAIDTAARELQPFEHFAIDAGGDLYLGGRNAVGEPWSVGIRHPRLHDQVIEMVRVSDKAVCTSGDYERFGENDRRHILDPRTASHAELSASATVVAPTAMLADALATAAFVLGPDEGIQLLGRIGVEGMILSPALERRATAGFAHA